MYLQRSFYFGVTLNQVLPAEGTEFDCSSTAGEELFTLLCFLGALGPNLSHANTNRVSVVGRTYHSGNDGQPIPLWTPAPNVTFVCKSVLVQSFLEREMRNCCWRSSKFDCNHFSDVVIFYKTSRAEVSNVAPGS